jgi:hypothetical protein
MHSSTARVAAVGVGSLSGNLEILRAPPPAVEIRLQLNERRDWLRLDAAENDPLMKKSHNLVENIVRIRMKRESHVVAFRPEKCNGLKFRSDFTR